MRAGVLLAVIAVLTTGSLSHAVVPVSPQLRSLLVTIKPPAPPKPATLVGELTPARGTALREMLFDVLEAQAEALLRQDQDGFLRPATAAKPREDLARRYRNLTAMRVSVFELRPDLLELDPATGHWRTNVLVSFCFVVPKCNPDHIREPMVWADTEAGPELVSISPASNDTDSWYGRSQPWEVSDLQVVVGARTIVATTARLKGRLAQLSREAEKAALVADQFATAGRTPDIYRVYLADKNEWNLWYGSKPSKWVAGYAEPIGEYRMDVVVSHAKVGASFLDDVLRHELTHVSTLHGEHHWEGNWWLIEGIAELAEHPQGLTVSSWSAQTKSYIRRGWDKKLPADGPPGNASPSSVGARYGVAFLAVKCLDRKFGRAKVLEFFARVVVSGYTPAIAAQSAFETGWAEVEAHCIKEIRGYA